MEIKVGDYVRTKNGSFTKIKAICEQRWKEPECIYSRVLCEDNEIYEYPKYIKPSPNIIDLIEVGDYVDGLKVIDIVEHLHGHKDIIMTNGKFQWSTSNDDYDIKSIVTKEQFASMEYKVER